MKPKQLEQPLWMRVLLFAFLLFAVSMLSNRSVAGTLFGDEEKKPKKEKATNNNAVKVYPDAFRKAMHVVSKSSNEKEISFYVFNNEGMMVLSYKLQKGEKKLIAGLPKGNYTYQAFCDDVQAGSGKMQFR
jgi:hypothetical protein